MGNSITDPKSWVDQRRTNRTPHELDLLNGLAMIRKHNRDTQGDEMKTNGFCYEGIADFVIRHGLFYKPEPMPRQFIAGAPQSCFANAMFLAAHGLDYIEEYAILPNGPVFEHAWNAHNGKLIDNTWMNRGVAYLGVRFALSRAYEAIWGKDGTVLQAPPDYAILCQPWRGETQDLYKVPDKLHRLLGWAGTEGMATPAQVKMLMQFYVAAQKAGHIFPEAAACEAVDESSWGTSELYTKAHNIFGCKQHTHPIYGTLNLPTREFRDGKWVVEDDGFVIYPNDLACFKDRMDTLTRLAPHYPHYQRALEAKTAAAYLAEVSQTWSTNPRRAIDCIKIMVGHQPIFQLDEA